MAAGAVVLNGIAVGPAVAIGGFVLAAQGEKALSKAQLFVGEVETAVARIDALIDFHHRGEARTDELKDVTARVAERADAALASAEDLRDSFDEEDDDHVRRLAAAMLICKSLAELLRAPVIDDSGELSKNSGELVARLSKTLEAEA